MNESQEGAEGGDVNTSQTSKNIFRGTSSKASPNTSAIVGTSKKILWSWKGKRDSAQNVDSYTMSNSDARKASQSIMTSN